MRQTIPRLSDLSERDLRALITDSTNGELIESPWLCDVLALHADLIERHNRRGEAKGIPREAKFAVRREPLPLRDLLAQDFFYLSLGSAALQELRDRYIFAEVALRQPDALCLELPLRDGPAFVVAFHSPLLYLINSSLSKIGLLIWDEWYGDCLPEDVKTVLSHAYSTHGLLAAFFNDIEVLFDAKRLYLPFQPNHIGSPFNYCEQVEGARRFVLAHELGHSLYHHELRPHAIEASVESDAENSQCRSAESVGDRLLEPWEETMAEIRAIDARRRKRTHEERWCDAFAMRTILSIYEGRQLTDPERFELENTLVGIMMLFFLYEVVEVVLSKLYDRSRSHTSSRARCERIRAIIKASSTFETTENLKRVLEINWSMLNALRRFAGGMTQSVADGFTRYGDDQRLLALLSPFGKAAHKALFDASADLRAVERYGFDPRWRDEDRF